MLVQEYVASADRGVTFGDGIFFGTADEHLDAVQDA